MDFQNLFTGQTSRKCYSLSSVTTVFLRNYRSCICYWEKGNGQESGGFLKKWKNKDRILTVCVLTDVIYILKRLQKNLQKDTCVLSDLPKLKERTIRELESLQAEPLTGGWEEAFVSKVDSENRFFGIDLQDSQVPTTCKSQTDVPLLLFVPRLFRAFETTLKSGLSMEDDLGGVLETLRPQTSPVFLRRK